MPPAKCTRLGLHGRPSSAVRRRRVRRQLSPFFMTVRSLPAFIDAAAESALRRRRIAGLSIAVAHDNRLLHADGYGYADLEQQIRASAGTGYGIGSVAQQFAPA